MSRRNHPHDTPFPDHRSPSVPPPVTAGTPRPSARPPFVSLLDIVVLTGAVLVALATAFVLQAQVGVGWELAAVAGLAVFAIAATLHILLQRTEEIGKLKAQIGAMERELVALRGPMSAQGMPGQRAPGQRAPGQRAPGTAPSHMMPSMPGGLPQGFDSGMGPAAQPSSRAMPPRHAPPLDQSASPPVAQRPLASPHHGSPSTTTAAHAGAGWLPTAEPYAPELDDEAIAALEAQAGDSQSDHSEERASLAPHAPTPPIGRPASDADLPVEGPTTPTKLHRSMAQATSLAIDEPAPITSARATSAQAAPAPAAPAPPAKSGGLFSSLGERLGRRKATATPTPPSATAPPPFADVGTSAPTGRQRVVNGWQGTGAPPLRSPAGVTGRQEGQAPPTVDRQPSEAAMPAPQQAAAAALPPQQPFNFEVASRHMATPPPAAPERPSHAADAISMPPPADAPTATFSADINPVDSLIQAIAARLAAERDGISTAELLALPAPSADSTTAEPDDNEPLSPEASAMAEAVREAVEAGRVEVHLQPILALDGLATVSYEAFPRLRDNRGQLIKPADYLGFAHRAGLSAGIEKLALLRAIHVLQQLDARGKMSPIFINVSQELLSDGSFFSTFIDAMKSSRSLSHNLVLEFSQPIAASFDDRDLESLESLARLGFTFALDDVDHVEMDFAPLISRGLAFVKIAGDVLNHGLYAGEAVIPADEIRPLFEDAGLQVIIHHLSSEAELDAALALSMTFGQGSLFAEPKPVKADVLKDAAGRAA